MSGEDLMIDRKKQIIMSKNNDKNNLRSTTTSVVNNGGERVGAFGTSNEPHETLCAILDLAIVKNIQVHDEDFQNAKGVTTAIIQNNYKNEQVRKMYVHY